MKFARYFQDNQTPEWKRAYIEYDKLKAQLKVIRANTPQGNTFGSFLNMDGAHTHHSSPSKRLQNDVVEHRGGRAPTFPMWRGMNNQPSELASRGAEMEGSLVSQGSSFNFTLNLLPHEIGKGLNVPPQQQPILPVFHCAPGSTSALFENPGLFAFPPLLALRSNLPTTHAKFFDMLDAELDKVETFYLETEKKMQESSRMLRKQVNELEVYREMSYASFLRSNGLNTAPPCSPSPLIQRFPVLDRESKNPHRPCKNNFLDPEPGYNGRHSPFHISALGMQALERARLKDVNYRPQWDIGVVNGSMALNSNPVKLPSKVSNDTANLFPGKRNHLFNPKEYQDAKRALGKVILGHYRGLEALNNYRIINLAGFRRALKHYERTTNSSVLDVYMKEKVEPSAFASGAMVKNMLEEIERLFEMRFEGGRRKEAVEFLRVGPLSKTHHSSTFQSGLLLGLAFTAIAGGIRLAFQEQTRASLPSWNILLFIYSVLALPVLLALLIGINILVWAWKRINYADILELNPISRLDHHEYLELPSFLLCTLASAFWFSMAQIGPPMLWPLVWLALTLAIMFNPTRRFMWGRARWWAIKNIAKLGVGGFWKVEFTDVWLGDQACSLIYSLSNLFFLGCSYSSFFNNFPVSTWEGSARIDPESSLYISSAINATTPTTPFRSLLSSAYDPRIQDVWSTCGVSQNFGWYCLLGALPFLARLAQNLRRYRDSRVPTHLINAGKYVAGIVYCFVFLFWKQQGAPRSGQVYVLWWFTGIVNSIYGCAWDFLMDWSLCKPQAKYPLLRQELIYESQLPCYYFALISNLCIRFLWLNYMFIDEANSTLYAFIVALLEMLRRVQWNFYRLENEHLANMHRFHDTHEVPLSYCFDVDSEKSEEYEKARGALSWLKKRMIWLKTSNGRRTTKSVV